MARRCVQRSGDGLALGAPQREVICYFDYPDMKVSIAGGAYVSAFQVTAATEGLEYDIAAESNGTIAITMHYQGVEPYVKRSKDGSTWL